MDINDALENLERFVNTRVLTLFNGTDDPRVFKFAEEIEEQIQKIKSQIKS